MELPNQKKELSAIDRMQFEDRRNGRVANLLKIFVGLLPSPGPPSSRHGWRAAMTARRCSGNRVTSLAALVSEEDGAVDLGWQRGACTGGRVG
jgi:hypothetical protein